MEELLKTHYSSVQVGHVFPIATIAWQPSTENFEIMGQKAAKARWRLLFSTPNFSEAVSFVNAYVDERNRR